MKKLTGFIALLLFNAAAFAQDSSTSARPNMDTGRNMMETWHNDTLGLYRWNDSGYYRRNRSLFDSAMSVRRRMWKQDSSYFVRGMGDTAWHYKLSDWTRDSMNYERRNWDSSTLWPDANRWDEVHRRNWQNDSSMTTGKNNLNKGAMRNVDSSHVRKPLANMNNNQSNTSDINAGNAQSQTNKNKDLTTTKEKTKGGKDRVYMKDNTIMVSKNGVSSKLPKSITLNDGTKVMMDGTIKMPDGQTMKLKNGESINLSSTTSKSKTKKG